jgi:hypothetical protein
MPIPLLLAGAAVKGLVGLGQAIFSGKKKKKKAADAAIDATEVYKTSPYETANLQAAQARTGAAMPGEEEAKMAIGQSATQALGAAKTRKGGLGAIGAIQAGSNKAQQDLAVKKAGFKLGAEKELSGARSRMTGELGKEFQSRQQKQSLKTQQALGELAGAKASEAQGLGMLGSAVSDVAFSGQDMGGLFKKKKKTPSMSDYSRTDYQPETQSYR